MAVLRVVENELRGGLVVSRTAPAGMITNSDHQQNGADEINEIYDVLNHAGDRLQ
jgi:hypothetical protein